VLQSCCSCVAVVLQSVAEEGNSVVWVVGAEMRCSCVAGRCCVLRYVAVVLQLCCSCVAVVLQSITEGRMVSCE